MTGIIIIELNVADQARLSAVACIRLVRSFGLSLSVSDEVSSVLDGFQSGHFPCLLEEFLARAIGAENE